LRNKVFLRPGFGIVIRPTMHGWKFSWPVAMNVLNRGGPFEGVRFPWILRRFRSSENAVEKVE
jgi:hypothetical protein